MERESESDGGRQMLAASLQEQRAPRMAIGFWTETKGGKLVGIVDCGRPRTAQIEVVTKGSARWWIRRFCPDPETRARYFNDIQATHLPASRAARRRRH